MKTLLLQIERLFFPRGREPLLPRQHRHETRPAMGCSTMGWQQVPGRIIGQIEQTIPRCALQFLPINENLHLRQQHTLKLSASR